MISRHIFYQLMLLGLLWLCIMRHVVWPSDHQAEVQTAPKSVRPATRHAKRWQATW
jgi:hypothetical protein